LDTGSARSRFTIYGQKVYLGSLHHGLLHWTIHKLFIGIICYYERLLLLEAEAIYFLQVDIISTGCYYDDVDIIQWNSSFSTCYIQVMSTRQFLPPMSPSSMFVYIQGHASHQSTYLIMLVPFV